ncbi:MAG: ATP-binding protein [Spirochaetales bacterium]
MKLARRFLLLTTSIILVPVLVGAALGIAQWLTAGWTASVDSYASARRWAEEITAAEQIEQVIELLDRRPGWLEVAVISSQNSVTLSTISELPVGSELNLATFLNEDVGTETFLGELFVTALSAEPEGAFLVTQFRRPEFIGGLPAWVPVVVGPFLLLTPVIAISLWILRDLRRSILTLRDAAVRIGSGDLDFELDPSGNDEFAEVRASFESMRRTIRDEYARRARFTMGVSHDLKTPLALIKGYAEAIEDGYAADPATLGRYVGIIRERSDLLQERITHLIEFLKLETGEWFTTLKPIELRAFLVEFAAAAAADVRLAGAELEASIDLPRDLILRFDPVLVRRALENLVQNAARHGIREEPVRFTARADQAAVTITVANAVVVGERETSLELLSEPLYRGDASRHTPGFGLGLAIVRSVVESHGWSIELGRETDRSIAFLISIPRDQTR